MRHPCHNILETVLRMYNPSNEIREILTRGTSTATDALCESEFTFQTLLSILIHQMEIVMASHPVVLEIEQDNEREGSIVNFSYSKYFSNYWLALM